MDNLLLISTFLVPVLVTVLLVPLVRIMAFAFGWLDTPDGHRKLHTRVTPSVGGMAIAGGLLAGMIILYGISGYVSFIENLPPWGIWAAMAVTVMAGFFDDTRGLGFKQKFFIQIVVAYILLLAGFRVDVSWISIIGSSEFSQALVSIPLTVLWVVGMMNAVNLIDGLDGLAAGVSLIAFASLAMAFGLQGEVGAALIALPMVGALVGFLVYNSRPASIFMGDSGSLLLGAMLAVFSLSGDMQGGPLSGLIVSGLALGLPITDTSLAMFRRIVRRQAICAPDSDHIHHRLSRKIGHQMAVLVLYGVALVFGASAVVASILELWQSLLIVVGVGAATGAWLYTLGYFGREASEESYSTKYSADVLAGMQYQGDGSGKVHKSPDELSISARHHEQNDKIDEPERPVLRKIVFRPSGEPFRKASGDFN